MGRTGEWPRGGASERLARWLTAAGEGLLLGLASGGLLGASQVRLHQDFVHGTLWLAAERVCPCLLAGAVAGLLLSVGTLHALAAVGGRATGRRILGHGAVSGMALLGAVLTGASGSGRWREILTAGRSRLAAAVVAALALAALVLVAARVRDHLRGAAAPRSTLRGAAAAAGGILFGAVAGFLGAHPWLSAWRAGSRPSVILVSLDTLRADRLGVMGYRRPTTPYLDALAEEGVVFEQAVSTSSWTLPAHVSLLTSRLPHDHRVLRVESRVRPDLLLLSEGFRDQGYRTAAFTGGGYVSWDYGFIQGFEVYENHLEQQEGGPAGIAAAALRWVRRTGSVPFFLFVHTYEVHAPYLDTRFADPGDRGRLALRMPERKMTLVEDPTPKEKRYICDLYDGDVAHADEVIGGFLHTLRAEGLLDRAILVVTSDHGEDLWDHDASKIPRHGHTLYEEIVHVPLFLRAPGILPAGTRVRAPVSHLDLAPTLLALAGCPPSPVLGGRNVSGWLRRAEEPPGGTLLFEAIRYGPERYGWREGPLKAVLTPEPQLAAESGHVIPDAVEVFDLARDPTERVNLAASRGGRVEKGVRALLERAERTSRRRPQPAVAEPPLSEELLEQLRSLGYVGP